MGDGVISVADLVTDVAFLVELASQRRLALLVWCGLISLISSVVVNTYASFLRSLLALDENGDGTKEVSDWLTQGNNNYIV